MASGTIKAVIPKSDIVNNLTTNDSTKVLSAAQGYALNNKTAYQSSTNLDTATGVGKYYYGVGALNTPDINYSGSVDVIPSANDLIYQFAINTTNNAFIRVYKNSEWTPWEQLTLNSKTAHVYGNWTPTFYRDTATNLTAKYARIGNVMMCSAKWTNVHTTGLGASYIGGLPSFSGATRITGFHGVWHSGNDVSGECGTNPVSNSFWFEKAGAHTILPDSTIEFVAYGIVETL